MASSHCKHQQDKTVLSVGVCGVYWVGDSRRQFCPVSSAVWTHSWTSLDQFANDVTIGNHIVCKLETENKTRLSSHRISRLSQLFRNFQSQTVLSCNQFSSHCGCRQDKTVLSCPCSRCELAIRQHSTFTFHRLSGLTAIHSKHCTELKHVINKT